LRARVYDPQLGRFITGDTYRGALGSPCSHNRFVYAANNPATLVDPGGHKPKLLSGWPTGPEPLNTTVCRGTSDFDYENPRLAALNRNKGMTPSTTDPIVATIFGLRGQEYGEGVVMCATPDDMEGVMTGTGGVLSGIENEIALQMRPSEFSARASVKITAQQARALIQQLFGYVLPSRIYNDGDLDYYVRNRPALTSQDMLLFYRTAYELYGGR
jgi:hypothetical protein